MRPPLANGAHWHATTAPTAGQDVCEQVWMLRADPHPWCLGLGSGCPSHLCVPVEQQYVSAHSEWCPAAACSHEEAVHLLSDHSKDGGKHLQDTRTGNQHFDKGSGLRLHQTTMFLVNMHIEDGDQCKNGGKHLQDTAA